VQAGLIVVAVAGVLAGALVVFMPKLVQHRWIARFKFVCWVAEHTTTPQEAAQAWVARASVSWVSAWPPCSSCSTRSRSDVDSARARLPLRVGSAAALPIAPAGGVAQAGAGRRCSSSSGIHASEAAAFAVAAQGMIVLAGAGVLVLTTTLHVARSRLPARFSAALSAQRSVRLDEIGDAALGA
jgi:hypothetical protein